MGAEDRVRQRPPRQSRRPDGREAEVRAVHHVGREDRMVHGQQERAPGRRRAARRPASAAERRPDAPRRRPPCRARSPSASDVGVSSGHGAAGRAQFPAELGRGARSAPRSQRAARPDPADALTVVVAGDADDRRPVLGVGVGELARVAGGVPVGVDDIAQVIEEAGGRRPRSWPPWRPRPRAAGPGSASRRCHRARESAAPGAAIRVARPAASNSASSSR